MPGGSLSRPNLTNRKGESMNTRQKIEAVKEALHDAEKALQDVPETIPGTLFNREATEEFIEKCVRELRRLHRDLAKEFRGDIKEGLCPFCGEVMEHFEAMENYCICSNCLFRVDENMQMEISA